MVAVRDGGKCWMGSRSVKAVRVVKSMEREIVRVRWWRGFMCPILYVWCDVDGTVLLVALLSSGHVMGLMCR